MSIDHMKAVDKPKPFEEHVIKIQKYYRGYSCRKTIKLIENIKSIQKLRITISRASIQGGMTNEEYGSNDLHDWRLQHHIPTSYTKIWKNLKTIKRDSKFSDLVDSEGNKSEGKKFTKEVALCPSRDQGAGRSFNQDNLDTCLSQNSHYFLYDRGEITDTTIDFNVYWIPIKDIIDWYKKLGNGKGKITEKNIRICLKDYEIKETFWDKS